MKKNIYLLYAMSLLQGMVFYGPISTLYRQAQGITVFQITLIESICLALYSVLEIPWGVAADKMGYRRTLIACSGLYFLSKIVFWRADSFADFLLERVMLCVVLAGISGVDSSVLYLSCQGRDSQKAFGIYNSMGMAGLLIAAGTYALFVRERYSLAGFLTVISYGLAALLSLGITEVKPETPASLPGKALKKAWKEAFRSRDFLLFLLAAVFLSETHQTITVFLNQLQYARCGLSDSSMGWIYIGMTVLGILGVYSLTVTRRMGIGGACVFFCVLGGTACLLLALTRSAVGSVLGIGALQIGDALFQPFRSEVENRQIHTANRATVLSLYALVQNTVAVGTNLAFGALSDRNLSWAFGLGMTLCAASLIFLLFWNRKAKIGKKEAETNHHS